MLLKIEPLNTKCHEYNLAPITLLFLLDYILFNRL
jgi:hypothetical protein